MTSESSQMLYSNADLLLSLADEEMSRAEEDAVTYLICRNARQSIINYLMGYLMDNNIKPIEPVNVSVLLQQCALLDARFGTVDFTPIECRFDSETKDYCLDMETVEACYRIAKKTGEWVKE